MRNDVLAVLGITFSLTALAGSVMAIPTHLPEREVKKLGNIDITSLWTSRPVSVDVSKQNYERLPALVVELPKSSEMNPAVDNIVTSAFQSSRQFGSVTVEDGETQSILLTSNYQSDTEVTTWCTERYRSYRAWDNTYQPHSGGRRKCEPPFTDAVHDTEASDVVKESNIGEISYSGDSHAKWCFARYRSFNRENGTYRAFSGEVRTCLSPYI